MNAIAEKIQRIEQLSTDPGATAALLDKVIECLIDQDRRKLAGFREKLADFERRHGMSTVEFLGRFEEGELGDSPEWFDWDGYAALTASLESKLSEFGAPRG